MVVWVFQIQHSPKQMLELIIYDFHRTSCQMDFMLIHLNIRIFSYKLEFFLCRNPDSQQNKPNALDNGVQV